MINKILECNELYLVHHPHQLKLLKNISVTQIVKHFLLWKLLKKDKAKKVLQLLYYKYEDQMQSEVCKKKLEDKDNASWQIYS